ncbi:hypothetical protein [Providencia sp. wls1914]|uniref:hypothetical protein n=1 Tax=Providencia sp. wls1914 TaxID=2675156 RepID=UPI0012B640AA|nr:hypothetical protein [Providencia sp. wls1914]MTC71989.1 hypothetical protein [Providencia sp. wls1914]
MNKDKMLVSIVFDTSKLDEKLHEVASLLPHGFTERFLNQFPSLTDNVIFCNGSGAVSAGATNQIIYFLDLDAGFYSQILSAAGAFKANFTHNSIL